MGKFSSNEILLWGTVKLTGTALKRALNHFHQSGQLSIKNIYEVFYDVNNLVDADFDKSWLEGFTAQKTADEEENYLNFAEEIERNRNINFPIQEPKKIINKSEEVAFPTLNISYFLKSSKEGNLTEEILAGRRIQEIKSLKFSPLKLPEFDFPPLHH